VVRREILNSALSVLVIAMSLVGCGDEIKRDVSRTVLLNQTLTDVPGREG
jgi:hypothetical protein